MTKPAAKVLKPLLTGGDRRSITGSNEAMALICARPARIAELAALAEDRDWLVSLRAMDLLEKLVHKHAAWVEPYHRLFLGPLADSDKWEMRLQIVRGLPFLKLSRAERKRAVAILLRDLEHPRKFVQAWALDSLAHFAKDDVTLRPVLRAHLEIFERSGSPALEARARAIRKSLASVRSKPSG